MKSKTLPIFTSFLESADAQDADFVDSVYAMCAQQEREGDDRRPQTRS